MYLYKYSESFETSLRRGKREGGRERLAKRLNILYVTKRPIIDVRKTLYCECVGVLHRRRRRRRRRRLLQIGQHFL